MPYELFGINLKRVAEIVGGAVTHEQARVNGVGEQQESARICRCGLCHGGRAYDALADEVLMAGGGFEGEALEVGVALLSIVESCRPDLLGLELLDAQDVLLVMVVEVEVGGIELAVVEHYKDGVLAVELA